MTDQKPTKAQRLKLAYQRTFLGEDGKLTPDAALIIADLAPFCRLHRSTLVVSPVSKQVDTHATLEAEGRREVLLKILGHLYLDDQYLLNLRTYEGTT